MSNSEPLPAHAEQTPDPLLGSGSFIHPNNAKEPVNISTTPIKTRPTWLPEGCDMILKTRTSGSTKGTDDRYFIAPSGQRLRSKNEVLTFLETRSKRKKPQTQSSNDTGTLDGSAPRSKKKTSARKKFHASFKFDLKNPPDKVSWFLSYASEDVRSPSAGDRNLPLTTKQEWAAVFNHVFQN